MSESTNNATAAAPEPAAPQANGKRKKLLTAVLAAFVAASAVYAAYWAHVARWQEATDDAYVAGNVVQITPQVAGTVVEIDADDTQLVHAGDELVALDRADASIALRRDEAALAQAVRQVRNLYADSARLQADVDGREVDLAKTHADLQRRERLAGAGAVSQEDVQHARDAVHAAEAALAAARERLAGNRALTGGTRVADHPTVQHAAAQLRADWLALQRTTIPAPVTGLVAKRSVQLGQRVGPGAPLMAVVPLDDLWVDANFKEVQLKKIRVRQPVRLVADANGFAYHGTVVGFAAGTGAAFSLLPAQNATGNWIKVVQRLPVRIALDPKELSAHPLAIGLSMQAQVDVHDQRGGALAVAPNADPAYRTTVFAQQPAALDKLIATIVARNGGGHASVERAAARVATPAQADATRVARSN